MSNNNNEPEDRKIISEGARADWDENEAEAQGSQIDSPEAKSTLDAFLGNETADSVRRFVRKLAAVEDRLE